MEKFKCEHCRLSFSVSSAVVSQSGRKFCCNGCMGVYELLHSDGLGEFYQRVGKNTLAPVQDASVSDEAVRALYDEFVSKDGEFSKISLVIDGIHCSACIWLIERALGGLDGVVEASVNATNHKAIVIWDDASTSLAEILRRIASVGYSAYAFDARRQDERLGAQRREFYIRLLVGVFCVMNIMWIAVSHYAGYFSGMDAQVRDILNFAEFILATPVLFYTGAPFFAGARLAIKSKTANMDALIASGASMAYAYSIYAMFSRSGEVYFDSVAMIITFVFGGKFLELSSKKSASDAIDGLNLLTFSQVSVFKDGVIERKSARDVGVGETIVVREGERVLLDGIVKFGEASFDNSSLSGESVPIVLGEGERIQSGGVCVGGALRYETTARLENSLLSKIVSMLEGASASKPQIATLANALSSRFSLSIIIIALITFACYFYVGSFERALMVSISVIIIACPCALALATPVATLVALSLSLKFGVIFKQAKAIETLAKCDVVAFDKTGTLTDSALAVIKAKILSDEPVIRALASVSAHPVSRAVSSYLSAGETAEISDVKHASARGVSAICNGQALLGGSAKFLAQNGVDTEFDGEYIVSLDGRVIASFNVATNLRNGARECVENLAKMGVKILILSGDSTKNVESLASKLGENLPAGRLSWRAECLPDEKAEEISALVSQGSRVVFVGDGVNDALAMSKAQVGICMGSGADVSVEKSDIVLLKDDLGAFLNAFILARATLGKIRQNLAFSLGYNALTIPLAVAGYVIPLFAAISMSLSSLVVVLNSLALRRKFKGKNG